MLGYECYERLTSARAHYNPPLMDKGAVKSLIFEMLYESSFPQVIYSKKGFDIINYNENRQIFINS